MTKSTGLRAPHAGQVDYLIKTTAMTNVQIAKEAGTTRQYVNGRRRALRKAEAEKVSPLLRDFRKRLTLSDMLINQVFC